jgi:hypothetical protein
MSEQLANVQVYLSLGTLVTLIFIAFKAGKIVADNNNKIEDAKNTAVRAHLRIDKLEE